MGVCQSELEEFFGILESAEYFETRIANNLFYGLKEFVVVPYTLPKANLGLRRYKFMTLPMRVLYYAVGLYLLQLSKEYLEEYYQPHKHIHANYGGNLRFKADELNLNLNSIYYQSHYQKFRAKVNWEKENDTRRKIMIRLDIANYYDELSISKLLDLLKERVKPGIQREMHHDETTQVQLVSFFDFIASGTSGIPQSDNNIISSFIGHLFLVFGDLFLDDELGKHNDLVNRYAIIRYMDDIYISITFKEQDRNSSNACSELYLRDKFNSLAPRISDCLYENLGLRLNPKTRLFNLEKKEDRDELEKKLKKVSQGIEMADEENNEQPTNKMEKIIKHLEKLRSSPKAPHFQEPYELEEEEEEEEEEEKEEEEVLKEVYDTRVQQMLEIPDHKSSLQEIFMGSGGFDFELVNADPLPIIILILACDDVPEQFEKFLRSKKDLTSRDISLILSYLCQIKFDRAKLKPLELLKQSPQMKEVMEIFEDSSPPKLLGYYGLRAEQVSKIAEPNVTEQIRLRVLCELKGEYSVALSHLLNEIHAICYVLDGADNDPDKYTEKEVTKNLFEKSFDTVWHQVNGSNVHHSLSRLSRAFIIQSQSAKPTEPRKGALHNPAQWDNHKSRSTQR